MALFTNNISGAGGTGNMSLTGSAATTYTIGGETSTGTIMIGRSNATNSIEIGNASFTEVGRVQYISIGTNVSSLGSALVSIGSTGGVGNTTIAAASTLTLTGSTGTSYIIGGEGQTGTITLGRSTASNTISIGSAGNNAVNTQTVNIGSGTGVSTITIGSTTGASAIALRAGSGRLTVSGQTTFNNNVDITGSLGASSLTVPSGVLYQANGIIQQDSSFVWDSANDRLGIGTASPVRSLHIGPNAGATFRLGPNTSFVEVGQANSATYRLSSGGTATTIEHNPNLVFREGTTLGFNASNGNVTDAGFSRAAAGVINVSGSAPGAVLRFNATSAPSAAGDLAMNTSTGRPIAYIDGEAKNLAHTDEVALLANSTFTGVTNHNAGLSGSLTKLTDGSSYLKAGSNIIISSASNGAVTISSTAAGAGSSLPVINVVTDYGADPAGTNGGGDAIQSAINAFMANPDDYFAIYIPPGIYRISSPLIIAKSDDYCACNIISTLNAFPEAGVIGGARIGWNTGLNPATGDKYGVEVPMLVIQGARNVSLQGINFDGPNPAAITDAAIGTDFAYLLSSSYDSWISSSIRDNPFSPQCAVAIDPFFNGVPGGASSNMYPGLESYYNNGVASSGLNYQIGSSNIVFDYCSFNRNAFGVVVSPSGPSGSIEVSTPNGAYRQSPVAPYFVAISDVVQNAENFTFKITTEFIIVMDNLRLEQI
jgi:hypothetical protein